MKDILILGGTGKTGRRVAERLSALGVPHRIASRQGTTRFDWKDRSNWAEALRGAGSLYVAYHPDLAAPGAVSDIDHLTKLAKEASVGHVVLLSGRGEPDAQAAEDVVRRSGIPFTIVRCAWFAQNFSEGVLFEAVQSGEVAFPAGSVAEPFVDVEDIADVAVSALTNDVHKGKLYELTGPRLLTFADAVAEISAVAGRPVRYVPITSDAFGAVLAENLPAPEATFFKELFEQLLDGHNAYLVDGVQQVLGRAPRDFRDYARSVDWNHRVSATP